MAGVRVLQGALIGLFPPFSSNLLYRGANFFAEKESIQSRKGDLIVAKKEQKTSNRPEVKEEQTPSNLVDFLKGTKEELGKIVWPSRKQLISESAGVILMVTLVATIVYLFDNLFKWIAGQVF